MKKLLYCVAALATAFFAGSCQRENLEPVQESNTVTFTVEAPAAMQTKAIADGLNVNELVYEVWITNDALGNLETGAQKLYQATTDMKVEGKVNKATITLDLVNDQKFTVLFWAQVKGTDVYDTEELNAVTYTKAAALENAYAANDERLAAFYGVAYVNDTKHVTKEGQPTTGTVTLRRPFAQINLGTLNTSTAYEVVLEKSNMIISDVPTVFNVVNSEVSEPKEMAFLLNAVPSGDDANITVNGKAYEYAGMNYVFAGDNVTVEYNIQTRLNNGMEASVNNTISSVPVKENYRTNIIGNLLTSKTDYEIIVDAAFAGAFYGPEFLKTPAYNEDTKTWTVKEKYELLWVADQVNNNDKTFEGETVQITSDIDLDGIAWTPIASTGVFKGTFEGVAATKAAQVYPTISNLTVATEGKAYAGLFASCRGTIKNINLTNVNISGHYKAGAIVGDGMCAKIENCHVDGAVIISTPYEKDDANHVGGIVGYLSAEPEAYVKNCSVKNATITAYRDVAGIAGMANGASVVTGNSVENVTIVADQTAEYVAFKTANAGAVVERKHANANVADNTVGEGVVITYKVDSSEELNDVLKNGQAGAVIEVAAGSYDALSNVKDNVTIIGAGYQYSAANPAGTRFYGHSVVAGEGVTVKNAHFANPSANWVLNYQNAALHNVTFEKCWFNDTEGIRYAYAKENVTFTECIFGYESCSRGVHFDNKSGDAEAIVTFNKCTLYGFQALGGGVDKFIFNDCTFAENTRPQNVVNMYNYVEYNNCKFNPLMHCDCAGNGVTAAFNGCSYTDGSNITSIVRFDKDPATCTVTFDGMPYSDAQNMTNVSDGLWTKTGDNGKTTYVATNANGLVALSATTIKGGETVELGGDIDLAGVEFAGLNAFNPENNNTFDGKGHTVSNWTYTDGASDMGFIKNWVGSIKNVTIEKASLKTSGRSAVVAAKVYANIENCHVVDCSIEDSYWACGLIAGLYNGGSVSNCSATNSFVKSNGGVAAIVGVLNESAGERSFTNCKVDGCTVNNTGVYGESYSGALVCGMLNISNSKVNFNGCQILNNTKEGKYVGDLYYATSDDVKVYVDGIWDGAPKVKTVAALQEALETSESDVVVAEEVIVVAENETVELDLNGKTLTAPTTSAFEVKTGGKLTLKNGNVESYEAVVRALGGEVVIESGKFVQTGTAVGSAVSTYRYAVDGREGGKVTINGGEFESGNGILNVNPGCELVINGGKFTNNVEKSMTRHFAYVSGKITINDGEFYGVANGAAGGCFFCGAASGCDITINGGKFTSLWNSGSVNRIFEVYYGGTINVTGGLFNSNGGIESFVEANTDAATMEAYPYVAK